MARGRSPLYDDQRDQILAQAARLFAERGYSGTSMNEVAAACGVSKPTLYHYVRDKYQLLVEIAEAHVSRLVAQTEEVEAAGLDGEARLRSLIERFLIEYAGARDQHRVLTEDVRFLGDEDRRRILDVERRVVAAFARAIIEVRPDLAGTGLDKPVAMLLFGMINWMFVWMRTEGPLRHVDMVPIVTELFFGGIAAVRPLAALTLGETPTPPHPGATHVHSRAKPARPASPHEPPSKETSDESSR